MRQVDGSLFLQPLKLDLNELKYFHGFREAHGNVGLSFW
jgi:hypothetical protein